MLERLRALALACLFALAPPSFSGEPAPRATEQLIANVSTNEVDRGQVVLVRQPDGDWWVEAQDVGKLRIPVNEAARRTFESQPYYSIRALGAMELHFDESALSLNARFPLAVLPETHIDLSNRPPPVPKPEEQLSLLMGYRISAHPSAGTTPAGSTFQGDMNVRAGKLLLRQEMRTDHGATGAGEGAHRGASQAIWDDLERGTRLVVGDTLSSAGAFGSTVTGAGVAYSRLFQLTPDVIRQPTASLRASSALPSDVEVSVDGTTLYRSRVPPGPIALDNLLLYGGTRNVRVTITDASGRREVYDQPFLFTDAVLAAGLHEFSYFAGRRSNLDAASDIRYIEPGWQGFHRYGLTDSVTLSAGGEGGRDFTNGGVGAAYRSDLTGVYAGEVLASHDHETGATARGWAGRYTYQLLGSSIQLARRHYDDGFRTFGTTPFSPFLRSESALAVSTRILGGVASAGASRQVDALGPRTSNFLRYTKALSSHLSLVGELQQSRFPAGPQWFANVYLRFNLDSRHWASASASGSSGSRVAELTAGQQLPPGEGVGYRVGSTTTSAQGSESTSAFGSASWNSRYATVDVFGRSSSSLAPGYVEASVSGAFVAADSWAGFTRPITDGFAVARLGVPQPGINVFLDNQLQGATDERGLLLVPNLGSYGRQTLSVDEKQLGLDVTLPEKRKTFSIPYRGGATIDFRGRRQRALAGPAWLSRGADRTRLSARTVRLSGPGGNIELDITRSGDFYLENAQDGRYAGEASVDGRLVRCGLDVVLGSDPVTTSEKGLICE
jgi:outer membrane usher protein